MKSLLIHPTIGKKASAQPNQFIGREFIDAAQNGDIDKVKALLKARKTQSEVNIPDLNKITPLMYAAQNGHTAVIKVLLRAQADVDAQDAKGSTALMYAVHNEHMDAVKALLRGRADMNTQDANKTTALLLAAQKGRTDMVEVLLRVLSSTEGKAKSKVNDLFFYASLTKKTTEVLLAVTNRTSPQNHVEDLLRNLLAECNSNPRASALFLRGEEDQGKRI